MRHVRLGNKQYIVMKTRMICMDLVTKLFGEIDECAHIYNHTGKGVLVNGDEWTSSLPRKLWRWKGEKGENKLEDRGDIPSAVTLVVLHGFLSIFVDMHVVHVLTEDDDGEKHERRDGDDLEGKHRPPTVT